MQTIALENDKDIFRFDLEKLAIEYEQQRLKSRREWYKVLFSILTFGLGAIYLWITTSIVRQGYVGLRSDSKGNLILLPPGRHSNFPWESYPVEPQKLSENVIPLGTMTIVRVETGHIAKTNNNGKLVILEEGMHILGANHKFEAMVSTKQNTKKLEQIEVCTSDNIGVKLQADVRYRIVDARLAISQVHDIQNSIKEIATMAIAAAISHHSIEELAPATVNLSGKEGTYSISAVIDEINGDLKNKLSTVGIELLSIGITNWNIINEDLSKALGQAAVLRSQTSSQAITRDQNNAMRLSEGETAAKNIRLKAAAEAEALRIMADTFGEIAIKCASTPAALDLLRLQLTHVELVKAANNPYLFFTPGGHSQHNLLLPAALPAAANS